MSFKVCIFTYLTANGQGYLGNVIIDSKSCRRNFNDFGIGEWSEFNSLGAHIRQTPSKMGPLSVVSKRETEITLSWSELTGVATGNSDILSYNLYWDDNTGVTSILLV